MEQHDFLDFVKLLKGPLILRQINEEKKKFVWNYCQWIKYRSSFGHILKRCPYVDRGNNQNIILIITWLKSSIKNYCQFRKKKRAILWVFNRLFLRFITYFMKA